MNIKHYKKEMVVEFIGTEKAIKFEVELTEVRNHFDLIVKEEGVITLEICVFKLYEEFNDLEIKKNSSNNISLILNNLLSSRRIANEFPILKKIENKLENK